MPLTFLSNHAHVLAAVARKPDVRMRDVADRLGITERAVQRIVRDLEQGGYLARLRQGRRNRYVVRLSARLEHPLESHCRAAALIELAVGEEVRESPPVAHEPVAVDDSPSIAPARDGLARNDSFID